MAMPNLSDDNQDANINDVCTFIETMAGRGELPQSSAQQKISAVKAFASILADDEPHDARYLLNNLESISRRYATKNAKFKGSTVRTYESKARAAIEAFFEWTKDPKGFKFERHERHAAAPRVEKSKHEQAASSESMPAPVNDSHKTFRYPLSGGREFRYGVPDDGLSVAEVRRIGMHLLTLARDWEPGFPPPTNGNGSPGSDSLAVTAS